MTGAADRHLSARQKLQRRFMANQNVRFPDGQAGFPVGRKDRRKVKSVCVRFDGLVRAAESNVKEPVTEFPLSLYHGT
jgi:hypothetical protein